MLSKYKQMDLTTPILQYNINIKYTNVYLNSNVVNRILRKKKKLQDIDEENVLIQFPQIDDNIFIVCNLARKK